MTRVPRAALILGLAGLIPFLWGMVTVVRLDVAEWGISTFGPRFIGPYVQLFYGAIILSFMSGVLWGFAAKATGPMATLGYVLSIIPALWAFLMTGDGPVSAGVNLMVGFVALLALDWHFWRNGLAPDWWMSLRIFLTGIVVISYIPVVA